MEAVSHPGKPYLKRKFLKHTNRCQPAEEAPVGTKEMTRRGTFIREIFPVRNVLNAREFLSMCTCVYGTDSMEHSLS
jgi:hypothetical protein